MKFSTLTCHCNELRLELTLCCGQSFRWQQTGPGEWTGVAKERLVTLKQLDDVKLQYCIHNSTDSKTDETFVIDYFRLHEKLNVLSAEWSKRDKNFAKKMKWFPGIRILRQDAVETLFAFICSSNNNITRISNMVEKLCVTYGHKLGHYKDKDYFTFPPVEALAAEGVEETLRSLGFGYRAGYIHKTAKLLVKERPKGWLECLRDLPYSEAHSALLELTGVGAKVADCVCLMGLDKLEAVPVDTHVWQIAVRDYGFKSIFKGKTLSNKAYKQVGKLYLCTCVRACLCECVCMCICNMCVCACVHTYIHVSLCVCVSVCPFCSECICVQ